MAGISHLTRAPRMDAFRSKFGRLSRVNDVSTMPLQAPCRTKEHEPGLVHISVGTRDGRERVTAARARRCF